MSDKKIYIAYVVSGTQLLRYAFEHPIVEFWAEPEEQAKLINYFKTNHYSHDTPVVIEEAEIMDYMAYKPEAKS